MEVAVTVIAQTYKDAPIYDKLKEHDEHHDQ